MMLPYKEPSQVLAALMDKIVEEGRRFASASDMKVSDMSANSPVGSTLAILERTLKVMSAVNARIYYSMKKEFKLLKTLIRDYTDPDYKYDPSTGTPGAKQEDYDKVQLIPVADPNAATMAQKVVQYQAVMQMAQQNPQIYDLPELNRQMLEVLGVKNADKLIPTSEDEKPEDPVSENMDIINNKPVKAFIYQDHEAHLIVHMSFRDDPKMKQVMGQNPKAQLMLAAMEAHIAEHVAFEYRRQIEEQIGATLPPPNTEMDETSEMGIARLSAKAAKKLLQKDVKEAQMEQNQAAQKDPILQMQQQELKIKQQEAQVSAQKTMADIEIDRAKIAVDKLKIETDERIAGAKIGANASLDNRKINAKELMDGTKMGMQAVQQEQDFALRSQESQSRNAAKVEETKLKDETQLNIKE
jgi:hypothetical protein